MQFCQECGEHELEIFNAKALKDMIEFKWNKYAYFLHYLGSFMHFFYIMTITVYIYNTFLIGVYGEQPHHLLPVLMCMGLAYPFLYDTFQLWI